MPRPTIKVDTLLMQEIADHKICKDLPAASHLYKYIADQYNSRKNSMLFPRDIDPQVVGLRIKSGHIKLSYPLPQGRRGKLPGQSLSAEHKQKLVEGRKCVSVKKSTTKNSDWAELTREKWRGTSFEKTAENAIKGSRKAKNKLCCIDCMGGDHEGVRNDVRGCTAPQCIWFLDRPFQKKDEV